MKKIFNDDLTDEDIIEIINEGDLSEEVLDDALDWCHRRIEGLRKDGAEFSESHARNLMNSYFRKEKNKQMTTMTIDDFTNMMDFFSCVTTTKKKR